ncbi:MAG: restriction endonuclease subunit S, partial [Flavobacteriaceae bacterium]|nr:restriction endonuclease subunit S [Flavobacteriaceae bacterium]
MNKTKKILPKLRFPEFKDSGEWEEKKISDLGHTINGLTGKNGEDFGAGKPYVTYKQVFDNSIIDFKKCGKVQIGKNENQNSLQMGDVLFTTSSETPNEVGFASVLINYPKEETYLNSFCFALRPFDIEKTQPQFFRYLFYSPIYRKSVTAIAQGSTRYNLSKGAFLELQVPIPNPKEQQKIAACLSSLDELISAHSQKLELLKTHKKGLMQNLFPQEGEKVPKLRFKEFEDSGEWEGIAIESVGKVLTGGTPSKEKNEYWGGDFIWVTAQDFKGKYIYDSILKLTKKGKNKSKVIPKNSVLVTCIASIGLNAINKVECATNQQINSIVCNTLHHYEFVYYAILKNTARLKNLAGQTAVPIIAKSIFEKFTIQKPISQQEQQKIASCLSSLDELITAQSKKIEQLK